MPTDRTRLARRLRAAREARRLTQGEVASFVGIPRPSIAEIEAGRRNVSGLELERLASLFEKPVAELLGATDTGIVAHFRKDELADLPAVASALESCLEVGRQLVELERLAGLSRFPQGAVQYEVPTPDAPHIAISQGARTAEAERRRLALGDAAISDLVDILEANGVRNALIDMPNGISGLTVIDPDIGPLVVANKTEHVLRRAFSYAHEYAHVLFDRSAGATVSREKDGSMREVRANAFASAFLMPEQGVRRQLAELGKGAAPSDTSDGATSARRGAAPQVQIHDLAILAHAFGVSRLAMAHRLRSLRILSTKRFTEIRSADAASGSAVARALALPERDHAAERDRTQRRFVRVALEAYGRGRIDASQLERHLVENAGMRATEARKVVVALSETG